MKKLLLRATRDRLVDEFEVHEITKEVPAIPKYVAVLKDPSGSITPEDVGKVKTRLTALLGTHDVVVLAMEPDMEFEMFEVEE